VKVCVFSAADEETVVWQGTDPTPKGSGQGVSKIPAANVSFPTSRVEVYLDSAAVPGWNEIDAVALVDRANHVQWARAVQASSTYASGPIPSPSGKPESLVPSWCSLASLKLHPAAPPVSPPNLLAAAFGWPLLALHGERSLPEVAQNQPWGYRPAGFSIPTGNRNQPPLLPRRPIWTGFLLDTVFFGLVLSVAWWVLTRPRAIVREFMRLRRGQCLRCGYNLLYDFARGCPECGWLRDMNASGRRVE
jgi:hypothetical protein